MHTIIIEIGDWSGDGHGKMQYFTYTSNLPPDEVREAYFVAKHLHQDLCPEEFCAEYDDRHVPESVVIRASERGFDINPNSFDVGDMAEYTAWFCMLGNPELSITKTHVPTRLAFYGKDEKGRHIGFIGYGMF